MHENTLQAKAAYYLSSTSYGRQQNPEHGTFRNIPEKGKLSQNKWKKSN